MKLNGCETALTTSKLYHLELNFILDFFHHIIHNESSNYVINNPQQTTINLKFLNIMKRIPPSA